jgi:uncharacterized membrane protein
MLNESPVELSTALAFFRDVILIPDNARDIIKTFLRWGHFLSGITWIGLLYFFNLVNGPLQKTLDAQTKGKVNPELLSRALWYFRWGAVLTVLFGLTYYSMYILPDATQPEAANVSLGGQLAIWAVIVLVTYAILFFLYRVPALTKDGRILAVVVAILVFAMAAALVAFMGNNQDETRTLGNRAMSIAVGGGMGILMLLNVWGIIWPAQKRIINWTRENAANGTPIPPESAALARQAFLASRTNAWLSLPMLFFMATAHQGDWNFFNK